MSKNSLVIELKDAYNKSREIFTNARNKNKNLSDINSLNEESEEDISEDDIPEEFIETEEVEVVNFNKKYIVLGLIIFVALGGIFFVYANQSNIQNSESSQNQESNILPDTTIATPSAISEAIELGKLIGCDTLHFDLEYGRLLVETKKRI